MKLINRRKLTQTLGLMGLALAFSMVGCGPPRPDTAAITLDNAAADESRLLDEAHAIGKDLYGGNGGLLIQADVLLTRADLAEAAGEKANAEQLRAKVFQLGDNVYYGGNVIRAALLLSRADSIERADQPNARSQSDALRNEAWKLGESTGYGGYGAETIKAMTLLAMGDAAERQKDPAAAEEFRTLAEKVGKQCFAGYGGPSILAAARLARASAAERAGKPEDAAKLRQSAIAIGEGAAYSYGGQQIAAIANLANANAIALHGDTSTARAMRKQTYDRGTNIAASCGGQTVRALALITRANPSKNPIYTASFMGMPCIYHANDDD